MRLTHPTLYKRVVDCYDCVLCLPAFRVGIPSDYSIPHSNLSVKGQFGGGLDKRGKTWYTYSHGDASRAFPDGGSTFGFLSDLDAPVILFMDRRIKG